MKIQLVSDLHYEFMADRGAEFTAALPNDCDVLVVAGDLCPAADGLKEALEGLCARFPEVVFLNGNHEFYGGDRRRVMTIRDALKAVKNLHWLDKDVWKYKDRRFVGCTLWFAHQPYELIRKIGDWWQIKGLEKWVYDENRSCVAFLERECRTGDIVVTHHLPSYRSVHPKYAGSALNPFFVHVLDDLIETARPALWLHGHTHSSCDYYLDTTRVVCNPYGYWPEDLNHSFKKDMVLTV